MPDEDFDLTKLADYLHLDLSQVTKLAERGKLPGRRVGGAWRFAPAAIHHWLEERIGLSDAHELARVEEALARDQAASDEPTISIADMLPAAAIEIPLPARTRNSVITSIVDLAGRTGWLWDPGKMAEAVRTREDMFPTALETGVALLHPRRPLSNILERPFLALGVTERGLPFASRRGLLTDVFFLICSTDDRGHLRTLARLSRLLAEPSFLIALRGASSALDAHEIIAEQERNLPN
ncbi:MAG TPA: PTS sugar transporter subunit IIA [Pirellulales bacterium]|nr:PTS sugar transporter subunit IIA [Pirellulales bacterium]